MKVKIKETGEELEVEVRKDSDTGKIFYIDSNFNAYSEDEVIVIDVDNNEQYNVIPLDKFQGYFENLNKTNDILNFWKFFRCDVFKIYLSSGVPINTAADCAKESVERLYKDCKEFENRLTKKH